MEPEDYIYAGRFRKARALADWMLAHGITAETELCGDHWELARVACGQLKFPSRETQALALGMIAKGKP